MRFQWPNKPPGQTLCRPRRQHPRLELISFVTTDGTKYNQVKITGHDDAGITVETDSGIEHIAFERLTRQLQDQFHFSPAPTPSTHPPITERDIPNSLTRQVPPSQVVSVVSPQALPSPIERLFQIENPKTLSVETQRLDAFLTMLDFKCAQESSMITRNFTSENIPAVSIAVTGDKEVSAVNILFTPDSPTEISDDFLNLVRLVVGFISSGDEKWVDQLDWKTKPDAEVSGNGRALHFSGSKGDGEQWKKAEFMLFGKDSSDSSEEPAFAFPQEGMNSLPMTLVSSVKGLSPYAWELLRYINSSKGVNMMLPELDLHEKKQGWIKLGYATRKSLILMLAFNDLSSDSPVFLDDPKSEGIPRIKVGINSADDWKILCKVVQRYRKMSAEARDEQWEPGVVKKLDVIDNISFKYITPDYLEIGEFGVAGDDAEAFCKMIDDFISDSGKQMILIVAGQKAEDANRAEQRANFERTQKRLNELTEPAK